MNLYVGNLNFEATEDDLRTLFEEIGTVESIRLMIDKETGRSKGFAFVEMPDTEEAVIAMKTLNGRLFYEREIAVNLAVQEDKPKRTDGYGDRRIGGQSNPFQQRNNNNGDSYERPTRPQSRPSNIDRPSYNRPSNDRPSRPYQDRQRSYDDRPSRSSEEPRPKNPFDKPVEEVKPKEGGRPRIKRERVDTPIYRPKLDE